jgi:hypothetical protein
MLLRNHHKLAQLGHEGSLLMGGQQKHLLNDLQSGAASNVLGCSDW